MTFLRLHEGSDITISWTFAFALVLLSPAGALFAMALASALGDAVRRKPPVRVAFNAAQMVVSLGVAVCVLALPHGHDLFGSSEPMWAWFVVMVCAAAAAFFTNILLTSVVLALHEGIGVYPMVRKAVASNLSTDGMLLALGPVFAITATRNLFLVPLLVIAVWNVYRAASLALRRQHEATHDELTDLPNRRQFFEHATNAHAHAVALRSFVRDRGARPRRLQGDQRPARPPDRRPRAAGGRAAPPYRPPRHRCRVPARRRRVRDPADRRRRHRRRDGRGACACTRCSRSPASSAASRSRSTAASASPCTRITDRASSSCCSTPTRRCTTRRCRTTRSAATASPARRATDGWPCSASSSARSSGARSASTTSRRSTSPPVASPGFESLARWDHPRLGMIMPNEFVPLAEQTELMAPFTARVLSESLAQCAAWQTPGALAHRRRERVGPELAGPRLPGHRGRPPRGLGRRRRTARARADRERAPRRP